MANWKCLGVVAATLTILSLDALLTSCSSPTPAGEATYKKPTGGATAPLFSVIVDGKYGFIDRTGKLVIQAQFDEFGSGFLEDPWAEGLAAVCVGDCTATKERSAGGKWGYIDSGGKMIINPLYDYARPFSEGLAAVRVGRSKESSWGYSPDEKWGFIDKTGALVANPQFSRVASFKEGLAAVCVGNCESKGDGKEGYIDKTGKFVINPQFDTAYDFTNGLAQVEIGRYPAKPKRGYIDKTGKYVWTPVN